MDRRPAADPVHAAVLQHVDTRWELLDYDPIGAGHLDEEHVVAIGNQEPGRVYALGSIAVPNASTSAAARIWIMIDLLFTAADVKEATVLSQVRWQAAGEAPEPS